MFDPWVGKIPWRRKWQPISNSNILAWKSHGQRSLGGYSPWGPKESAHILILIFCTYSSFVVLQNISKLSPTKSSLLPDLFLAPFPPISSLFMLFLLLKCFHFPSAYHILSHLTQVHLLQRLSGNDTTLHPSYSYSKIWWVPCSVDLLYSKCGPWARNSWTPIIHAESHPTPESTCQPDARWLQCTSNFEMHCSTIV